MLWLVSLLQQSGKIVKTNFQTNFQKHKKKPWHRKHNWLK